MKKSLIFALCATAAAMLPTSAMAGKPDGKWQIKLLGTAVLPDAKITQITDRVGLPAGSNTSASDNGVPTLAVEYFLTPNISAETICCVTQHHVDGTGPIAGVPLVRDLLILPATVTVKYHLPLGAIKPYVGAGPAWYIMLDYKSPAGSPFTRTKVDSKFGVALQAGVDIAIGESGLGFSLDAKRYFVRPNAHFFNAAGTELLTTRHKLDPWVLSAGVAYRF